MCTLHARGNWEQLFALHMPFLHLKVNVQDLHIIYTKNDLKLFSQPTKVKKLSLVTDIFYAHEY